MDILLTGASGFVGEALRPKLIAKGYTVYGLSRHPPAAAKSLIPIVGDITRPNLGLQSVPKAIEAVYHLAGNHRLGEDRDGSIWETNVTGTRKVLEFCAKHRIPHLYFTSTAFTLGRNTYEKSKILNEQEATEFCCSHSIKLTIFKPSIILGTQDYPYPGHFSQFVALLIKLHQRAELIRRKLEGTLRLPVIEPVFRIKGNPEGKINLITVDAVAQAMATIEEEGVYWLTNPRPPTLGQLGEWVGEFIMVRIKFEPDFKPGPLEATFHKMATAFEPYLQGDKFPSNLSNYRPLTKDFIQGIIKRTLA